MAQSDHTIYCSFCDGEFQSSKDMTEHLMMCGNKTDQCPKCTKYVRRAIFAYHYENDCANLDEPTPEPQKPNGVMITVTCPFCGENHGKEDSKIHKKRCLLNPKNVADSTNGNYNQNSDPSHQKNNSEEDAHIPCEWCNKGISWLLYDNHTRTCREEYQRQQKQSRPSNQTRTFATDAVPSKAITPATGWCVHCGTERSMEGLAYHQMCCKMNPRKSGMH